MPSWGRPSGARQAKRRKDRDVYTRRKEENLRFEEVDSDSSDGQGVNIDGDFTSDALHFTGADLGAHIHKKQDRDYRHDSESSDGEEINISEHPEGLLQVALRDKEELLVQKALERIRRAQELGKTNVKLSRQEIEALERKSKKDQSKRKTLGTNLRLTDKKRSSGTSSPLTRESRTGKRDRKSLPSLYDQGENVTADYSVGPPGLLLSGHGGPTYAPLGYYPSSAPITQDAHRFSQVIDTPQQRAAQTLPAQNKPPDLQQRRSAGLAQAQQATSLGVSDRSRRLPDDPGWSPRSRSVSSHHPHNPDPYQYQQYSPSPPQVPNQFNNNRRIVSGPPDVRYPDVQHSSTRRAAFSPQQPYAASSEPSLVQRQHASAQQPGTVPGDDDGSEDSEDYGVEVDVVPYGRSYSVRVEPGGKPSREYRGQR